MITITYKFFSILILLVLIFFCSTVKADFSEDTYLLGKLIYGEARGESFYGKLAVGTIVMNRVESSYFPNTIKEVIFQPYHFSVVWQNKWNKLKVNKESLKAAKKVINGYRSFWKTYLYYYNPELAENKKFIYSLNKEDIQKIGDHIFTQHKK